MVVTRSQSKNKEIENIPVKKDLTCKVFIQNIPNEIIQNSNTLSNISGDYCYASISMSMISELNTLIININNVLSLYQVCILCNYWEIPPAYIEDVMNKNNINIEFTIFDTNVLDKLSATYPINKEYMFFMYSLYDKYVSMHKQKYVDRIIAEYDHIHLLYANQ